MSDKNPKHIRAAGYIRVSTPKQVDEESLTTQRASIERFAAEKGYELTEIYEDAGISGGTVSERHALLRCLRNGLQGKFTVIIIHRLSRFGRNATELLVNYRELKEAGIELQSISEGIDFSTSYGEAILGILSVIAQLERDIIKETMLENRIAKARRGVPTSGKLPYGRIYDSDKGVWMLDEEKALKIRQAAEEYLNGKSLEEIAAEKGINYNNLLKILKKRSGNKWVVEFKGQEPVVYDVPELLPEDVIMRVTERMQFNRKNNREDAPGQYVLTGFIRCYDCHSRLTGVTINYPRTPLRCYKHKKSDCHPFTYIHADTIEKAVFETIFENICDVVSFEKAIADSLPSEKLKTEIEDRIRVYEKQLVRIQKELDALVKAVIDGTLSSETISAKEKELLQQRSQAEEGLKADKAQLNSLPDPQEVRREADEIRRSLLERYSGLERLSEMTFEEKRALLHWIFDGKDANGEPYGIYISTKGRARKQKVDYFMYGKIVGLRTLKDGNINYIEDDTNYETNELAGG